MDVVIKAGVIVHAPCDVHFADQRLRGAGGTAHVHALDRRIVCRAHRLDQPRRLLGDIHRITRRVRQAQSAVKVFDHAAGEPFRHHAVQHLG